MSVQLELILGGARSGKSRSAEQRVLESGLKKVYIATATSNDEEMALRIEQHRHRRRGVSNDDKWHVIEEPIQLTNALMSVHGDDTCVLVDCLTLWLSNCLQIQSWESERNAFFSTLLDLSGRIIFVSNEVGLGIVPLGKLTREFVDASGLLHQELAEICQRVTLIVSGLGMELKPTNLNLK